MSENRDVNALSCSLVLDDQQTALRARMRGGDAQRLYNQAVEGGGAGVHVNLCYINLSKPTWAT